jgi:dynein heavy chain
MCKEIHITSTDCAVKFESALKRKVYTTPKSYLDLIGLYLSSLKRKREELQLNQRRLSSGLTKLEQANKQVAELQITLTELKPQLVIQAVKVAEALVKVEADSRVAADKESIVQREAEEVNKKA